MASNIWLDRKAIARVIKSGISVKDWQRDVSVWRLGTLMKEQAGKFCVNIQDGDGKFREWICDTAEEAAIKFLQVQ